MYIRSDLEEAIKKGLEIEKFSYIGIGKNAFDDYNLLVFDTNQGTMAIEIGLYKRHYIHKVKEVSKFPGYYYKIQPEVLKFPGDFHEMQLEMICLYISKEETYLETNKTIASFPGKAFDFTEELVLLALEQGGNWNVY